MIYVIAGSEHQFREYCRRNGVLPHQVVHVTNADSVRGVTIGPMDQIVRYGTWYNLRNWEAIREAIECVNVGNSFKW